MDNLKQINKIGEGSFGKVFKCQNLINKDMFASKFCQLDDEDKETHRAISQSTLREIMALKSLNHPNIIKIRDVNFFKEDNICIVMDLKEGNLKEFMGNQKHLLTWKNCKNICYQLLSALQSLENKNIMHRDIKPQNILISTSNLTNSIPQAFIADFGLSLFISNQHKNEQKQNFSSEVCTLWYRPPDVIMGNSNYDHKLDIWSLGVTLVELFAKGKYLFPSICELDYLYHVFLQFGTPNSKSWPGIQNLKDFKTSFPQWKPNSLGKFFKSCDSFVNANENQQNKKVFGENQKMCYMCFSLHVEHKDTINHQPMCHDCWLLIDFFTLMLSLNPKDRPSASRCLKHPFLKNISLL